MYKKLLVVGSCLFIFATTANADPRAIAITCSPSVGEVSDDFSLYRKVKNRKWDEIEQSVDQSRRGYDQFAVYLGNGDFEIQRGLVPEDGHVLIKIVHYKQPRSDEDLKIASDVNLTAERENPRLRGEDDFFYEGKEGTKSYQEYHAEGGPISRAVSKFHRVMKSKERYKKYRKWRRKDFAFNDVKLKKAGAKTFLSAIGVGFGSKYELQNDSGYHIEKLSANLRYFIRPEDENLKPLCFELGDVTGIEKTKIVIRDFDGPASKPIEYWRGRLKEWVISWR